MLISEKYLRKIIREEAQKLQEAQKRPKAVQVSPEYINTIIQEEFAALKREQLLAEAKKRQNRRRS